MKHWSKMKEVSGNGFALRLFFFIYNILHLQYIFILLRPLAFFYYCFSPAKRAVSAAFFKRIAHYNLAVKPSAQTVYRHFYSFSLSLVERIAAWKQDIKVSDLIIKNRDVYQEIITGLKEKKGCFFLCSHLGNIDLLRALAIQDNKDGVHTTKVNIIIDTAMSPRFNSFMRSIQEKFDINLINSRTVGLETALLLQEKLDGGEIIVMAGDRTPSEHTQRSVPVPFLGDPIALPYGAFLLPVILKAPLYYFFALREHDAFVSKYDFFLYNSSAMTKKKKKDEMIHALMHEYVELLEKKVLEYPLQWYNFFDIWASAKVFADKKNLTETTNQVKGE